MLLELTVMRLAYNFDLAQSYPVLLLVLWGLGLSMIVLAGLVWLPIPVLRRSASRPSCCIIWLTASTRDDSDGPRRCGTCCTRSAAFPLAGHVFITAVSARAVGGGDGAWLLLRPRLRSCRPIGGSDSCSASASS